MEARISPLVGEFFRPVEDKGELNRILEGWIRAKPEDWLWLHRRWPEAAYRERESGQAGNGD